MVEGCGWEDGAKVDVAVVEVEVDAAVVEVDVGAEVGVVEAAATFDAENAMPEKA